MQKIRDTTKIISEIPFLAEGVALLAGFVFLLQTMKNADIMTSILDEGAYLYKGYLYLTGQYTLYQPYGPWGNHMPLSFLIPGVIQRFFGPGLRSGRYFAIFLAGLTLLGLWILVRRLGNRWWAALLIVIVAWSPTYSTYYSTAVSQVLVACMLVWSLVFVVGKNRPLWQIAIGSVIAGMLFMTRINMAIALPILIIYVFWQHGTRAGFVSAIAGILTVIIGHALYWSDILQMWARWLPRSLTPFLDNWRIPSKYTKYLQPELPSNTRLRSLLQGIRFHYTAIIGLLAALLLWSTRKMSKDRENFRTSVFLIALFIILFALHLLPTLLLDYCPYCIATYLAFFSLLGLLVIVSTFPHWQPVKSKWRALLAIGIILALTTGIAYDAFEQTGDWFLQIPVPRFTWGILGTHRSVTLSSVLINKFHLEEKFLRRAFPAIGGLLIGTSFVTLTFLASHIITRIEKRNNHIPASKISNFTYQSMVILLLVGTILYPTKLIAGNIRENECGNDIIMSHELVGEQLREIVPPGSLVYWFGESAVSLLYLPRIEIYPPQLNDSTTYYKDGDSDILLKFGAWNPELKQRWLDEADFILIEARFLKGSLKKTLKSSYYEEIQSTSPLYSCRPDSRIRIFHKKP
jgi:hypothetical protein